LPDDCTYGTLTWLGQCTLRDNVSGEYIMAAHPHWHSRAAQWLERQPLLLVVALGLMLGLGLGLPGFLALHAPAWGLAWLGLFGLLWCLGQRATPVGLAAPLPAATTLQRRRDGLLLMVDLPGGRFRMGSPASDDMAFNNEKPQHWVTLSGFRIAVTPVTAGLYRAVMQGEASAAGREQAPAVNVRWEDAVHFCNALSERQGYRPCYRQRAGRWVCDWRADGYRLPTEAEWEYACRAGTTTRYAYGDDPALLGRYAWYGESWPGDAHEVAQKLPNAWGLYDMHGNVWEWCWDLYAPYTDKTAKNPRGPSYRRIKSPERRVVRGGSFRDSPVFLRSASRVGVEPEGQLGNLGFRCVRVPPQP
jgi:formylglycine-generating enzyme required for sulfatase activity